MPTTNKDNRKLKPGDLVKVNGNNQRSVIDPELICICLCETDTIFASVENGQIGLVLDRLKVRKGLKFPVIKTLINGKIYQICPGDLIRAHNK
jgi:hypothetical protein